MKKAKIYKPTKTSMQSGKKKTIKWVLEFITEDPTVNPLMGWQASTDTMSEFNLEFSTKDLAIASVSYTHLTLPTIYSV